MGSNPFNSRLHARRPSHTCFVSIVILSAILLFRLIGSRCDETGEIHAKDINIPYGSNTFGQDDMLTLQMRSRQRLNYTLQATQDLSYRPKDVLLIAHRGCTARFPENSIAAIAACAEEGAHMAEIDLRRTRDGVLVVLHDASPNQKSNVAHWTLPVDSNLVSDLSLDELQTKFRLVQDVDSGKVTPYRIASFRHALGVAKACGVHLWLGDIPLDEIVQLIHQEDAQDMVMLYDTNIQSETSDAVKKKIRSTFITKIIPADKHVKATLPDGSLWRPKGNLTKSTERLCQLSHETRVGIVWSTLWGAGDYFIRDPAIMQQKWGHLLGGKANASPILQPCPDAEDGGEACLGAHLFGPLATGSCARALVTDLVWTAREGLLATQQHATLDIFPLETKRQWQSLQPRIPLCMEQWIAANQQLDQSN